MKPELRCFLNRNTTAKSTDISFPPFSLNCHLDRSLHFRTEGEAQWRDLVSLRQEKNSRYLKGRTVLGNKCGGRGRPPHIGMPAPHIDEC